MYMYICKRIYVCVGQPARVKRRREPSQPHRPGNISLLVNITTSPVSSREKQKWSAVSCAHGRDEENKSGVLKFVESLRNLVDQVIYRF